MIELLRCPHCNSEAFAFPGDDNHVQAVYCTECPLGVEDSGWTLYGLAILWNTLPRNND